MSGMVRYANPVQGERDRDGDHIVDGRNSSSAPIYEIDLSKATSVFGYGRLTLSMLRWQFIAFSCFTLFVWFVLRPIVFTAPVALFTNKPRVLTEKEAGSELGAATNNFTVGVRTFLGSAAEGVQERQIKDSEGKGDRRPAEGFIPKTTVVFTKN